MLEPFIVHNRDVLGIAEYRLRCMIADDTGIVIEDGIEYPVNRYGVFKNNKEPPSERRLGDISTEIIKRAVAKHRAEGRQSRDHFFGREG